MPPSGHSHSHHSSSHHSSHSTSHHSSSRSYSSHSSHSSSHHSSSSGTSTGFFRTATPVRRTRSSQPYGWNHSAHGAIKHYYCASHDYDYYPSDWTASDGRSFKEGYYDENGQHYDNMVMAGGSTMLKCSYCGNHMVYQWAEGDLPVCDKCGAQFQIDITDKEEKKNNSGVSRSNPGFMSGAPKIPLIGKIAIATLVICMILPFISLFLGLYLAFSGRGNSTDTGIERTSVKNSVYVEEIGRTCDLDGEDWYDSKTQCWFYYCDEVAPYQWQYWYEGISSDYGDYGWMEYDMGEDAWYIETSAGNWVHLPSHYDTSKLWHMTDEYVNEYD